MKCTIMRNDATWGGGGINAENSIFVINDCVIDSNQSGYGGGIYSKNCTISLFVCEITNNLATAWDYSEGGGIYCGRDSYIDIQDCIISSNESWYIGGGISCHYLSDMVITNSIISDNVAQAWELISYGGGICGSPTMTNCIISGNEAQDGGGIGGSPTMTNCVIFKNRAPWGKGGGICGAYGSKNLTLTNCTVTENLAVDGGAIYFYGSPQAQIVNSIIWDNRYDELYVDSLYANPIITYSDIKGGWQGESNINLDPLFVDPESLNFHLQALSPCIDAGDPFYEVPVGGGRRIDMGAYEYWLGWNVKDLNSYRHYFKDNNEFLLNFTEKLQKKFK
jgi:predicted outer membrane repeat protein